MSPDRQTAGQRATKPKPKEELNDLGRTQRITLVQDVREHPVEDYITGGPRQVSVRFVRVPLRRPVADQHGSHQASLSMVQDVAVNHPLAGPLVEMH